MVLDNKLHFSTSESTVFVSRFGLPPTAHSDLEVRTARTREDFQSAFRLLQQRYESVGLSPTGSKPMRIMPFHLLSSSQVFVALIAGKIVGTVTLVQDSEEGLPMSDSYPRAISKLRRQGRKIAEISSLAVDSSETSQGEIFGQLTRLLTFFARDMGLEYLAAVVHPRHAKFYRNAMGFEVIGKETRYAAVCGNPGIGVMGRVNDPSRYRPRWQNHYFDGVFHPQELQPRPMTYWDREYFSRRAMENGYYPNSLNHCSPAKHLI